MKLTGKNKAITKQLLKEISAKKAKFKDGFVSGKFVHNEEISHL